MKRANKVLEVTLRARKLEMKRLKSHVDAILRERNLEVRSWHARCNDASTREAASLEELEEAPRYS